MNPSWYWIIIAEKCSSASPQTSTIHLVDSINLNFGGCYYFKIPTHLEQETLLSCHVSSTQIIHPLTGENIHDNNNLFKLSHNGLKTRSFCLQVSPINFSKVKNNSFIK